ncbi:MAG: hypothetical protein IJQ85_02395 [Selenomonadaceae bacterium]|nr:hypothetical protein [Selenomonadaceae bacterium]
MSDIVYARLLRNLDEPYRDCTGQIKKLFREGQILSRRITESTAERQGT